MLLTILNAWLNHAEHICEFAQAKQEEKFALFAAGPGGAGTPLHGKVLDICKKAVDTLEQDDLNAWPNRF